MERPIVLGDIDGRLIADFRIRFVKHGEGPLIDVGSGEDDLTEGPAGRSRDLGGDPVDGAKQAAIANAVGDEVDAVGAGAKGEGL